MCDDGFKVSHHNIYNGTTSDARHVSSPDGLSDACSPSARCSVMMCLWEPPKPFSSTPNVNRRRHSGSGPRTSCMTPGHGVMEGVGIRFDFPGGNGIETESYYSVGGIPVCELWGVCCDLKVWPSRYCSMGHWTERYPRWMVYNYWLYIMLSLWQSQILSVAIRARFTNMDK